MDSASEDKITLRFHLLSRRTDRSNGEECRYPAGDAEGVVRVGMRVRDLSQRRFAEPPRGS